LRTPILLALSCFAFGAACASTDSTTYRTAVRYDEHVKVGQRAPARDIFIEDKVADLCDIAKTSSFFAPGSAGADEIDYVLVRRVAECMKEGPLKESKVVVIGYTDPRGSPAFNSRLGLERAESVAGALAANGIDRKRLFIKSYGETKASDALSETDWAKDRKVTLRVAEPR